MKYHRFKEGDTVAIVSMREALLTGRRGARVHLPSDLVVHQLIEHRGDGDGRTYEAVWMSDEPLELRQAADWLLAVRPRGRVLVGGLGLGVVASWLAELPQVEHVTVVEIEEDVVRLVAPHQSGYEVVRADIMEYLRGLDRWDFDFAFLDTWQGTNEGTWWETVMPMRRLVANRFGRQRVTCWAEDMMVGQVGRALLIGNRSTAEKLGLVGAGVAIPQPAQASPDGFQRTEFVLQEWGRHWHYTGFPEEMSEADVRHFLFDVGLPAWERRWGPCLAPTST